MLPYPTMRTWTYKLRPRRSARRKGSAVPFECRAGANPQSDQLTRTLLQETNDCVVIAVSIALGVPYRTAHAELERRGRKHRDGVRTRKLIQQDPHFFGRRLEQVYECLGRGWIRRRDGSRARRPQPTIRTFAQRFNRGTFLVVVSGHATVIKDGRQMGLERTSDLSRVRRAWQVPTLLLPAPASLNTLFSSAEPSTQGVS